MPSRPAAASRYARQLRAVADEHGFDVVPAARSEARDGVDEERSRRARRERRPANTTTTSPSLRVNGTCPVAPGRKALVSAPHSVRRIFDAGTHGWNDLRAGRHDQICLPALPVAPAAHRLDDERAVDEPLQRAWMIDDRRIHLEHGQRADLLSRRECLLRRSCSNAR